MFELKKIVELKTRKNENVIFVNNVYIKNLKRRKHILLCCFVLWWVFSVIKRIVLNFVNGCPKLRVKVYPKIIPS